MKNIIKFVMLSLVLNIFLGSSLLNAAPTKAEVASSKKIIGYFPDWGVYGAHRNYFVKHIPWDKLTHIQVAFAKVAPDSFQISTPDAWADLQRTYGESWDSQYKGNYGQLRKIKVAYPHVSVLISIGGWTLSSQFYDAGSTDAKAMKFADEAVKFMVEHGFDGVDIDWEFPTKVRAPDKIDNINDEGTPNETPASKQGFTRLLKHLRAKLDAQGATDNTYYQLSAAVGSSPGLINATEPDKYIQYLDFLNIMSYDMHGAWDATTNHQSPLFVNPDLTQDNISIDHAVKLLHDTYGVPKDKLIIGSPFYSRGWKGVDCSGTTTLKDSKGGLLLGLNCPTRGGAEGRWDGGRPAGVNSWFDIVNEMRGKDGFKVYRDDYAKVPYLYSESKKEFYTYEDEISVKTRTDYVKSGGYGGIIIWEISADTRTDLGEPISTNLLNIIHRELYENTDITAITEIPRAAVDNTQTQNVATEQDIAESTRQTDRAEGAANVGTALGLSLFDPTHGPASHPHYNKGEQVVNNAGNVCTAKWYASKSPDDDSGPWDCEFSNAPRVAPTVMTPAEQAGVQGSAENLANNLQTEDTSNNGQLPVADTMAVNANDPINQATIQNTNSPESNASTATDSAVNVTPLSAAQISAQAQEANQCHANQVYLTGDICQKDGIWYKFKWWTTFDGNVGSSMEVTQVAGNEPTVQSVSSQGLETWSSTKTYSLAGVKVVYQGNVYESKYWTNNNQPVPFVSNTPWKYLGVADSSQAGTTGTQAPTTTQVQNTVTTAENPIVVANDTQGTTATFDTETNTTVVTVSNPTQQTPATSVPSTKTFFMPFVDATSWPPYKLADGMANGVKHFALSFVNSSGGVCSPTWGNFAAYPIENTTLNIPTQINAVTQAGGSIMISFGGATAHADELANVCTTVDSLTAAYQEVLDKTGVKMIDFDIEGGNSYNTVNVRRRMQALKKIKDANPDVEISFTLATMPTGLLAPSGLMIVKTAVAEGVKFSTVNLMLMDYGTAFPANVPGAFKMAAYSIKALQSVNEQLKIILKDKPEYVKDSNGEFYNILGAIPMIGRNDTLNEYFYRSDVKKLTQWCDSVGIRLTSMWSINRDKPIGNGESADTRLYQSTKLPKGSGAGDYGNSDGYEFAKLLERGVQ